MYVLLSWIKKANGIWGESKLLYCLFQTHTVYLTQSKYAMSYLQLIQLPFVATFQKIARDLLHRWEWKNVPPHAEHRGAQIRSDLWRACSAVQFSQVPENSSHSFENQKLDSRIAPFLLPRPLTRPQRQSLRPSRGLLVQHPSLKRPPPPTYPSWKLQWHRRDKSTTRWEPQNQPAPWGAATEEKSLDSEQKALRWHLRCLGLRKWRTGKWLPPPEVAESGAWEGRTCQQRAILCCRGCRNELRLKRDLK